MSEIIALIASQNTIKQMAATEAIQIFYDGGTILVDLSATSIDSGIRPQPLSLEEATQGVLNRIGQIKNIAGYAFYIAVEGGAYQVGQRWFESACAGVLAQDSDKVSIGFGPAYPIPRKIAKHLDEGLDLNEAMEVETGVKEIGKAGGFNGWLTEGKVDRKTASAEAILMALYGTRHLDND